MHLAAYFVGQTPGQELEQEDPEGVHIAARVQLQRIGQHLFRTHIRQRSHDLPHIGLARVFGIDVGHAGHTEIQNLRLAALIHQNIAGLEIAVNDPSLMRMVHGVANLRHQLQPLPRVQLMALRILEQRVATYELHREIRLRS